MTHGHLADRPEEAPSSAERPAGDRRNAATTRGTAGDDGPPGALSDALLAALAQQSEGVIVTDADGRITFVNEAAARLHGVARLDVAPEAYAETYHLLTEDGAPYPSAELPLARAVLRGEDVVDARWRIRRPDGTEVHAVGSARPVIGPEGRQLGAVLTVRDDTARAAAAAAEGRAARLLEQVSDAHVTLDRAFRFVTVNPVAERLLGTPRDALLGRTHWEVFPASVDSDVGRAYRRVAAEGVEAHLTQHHVGEGDDVHLEIDAYPTTDGGVAVFWRDVTTRVRAAAALLAANAALAAQNARHEAQALELELTNHQLHEQAGELEMQAEELQATAARLEEEIETAERARADLAESERQFHTLADAIPTLAWTARADGYIDWYNARWYAYTGTTPKQMAGWGWQSVHDPAALADVLARWTESIASGDVFEMTFPLRGADGGFRRFLTRVTPVHDGEGRVVRWFGTNTDIEAERAARDAAERATTRTMHLQALTAALAGARTVDDVAAVLVAEGVRATGAATGMLAVRAPDAAEAVTVRQTGLTPEVVAAYARFPVTTAGPTTPGPAAYALRTGEAVFVEAREGPDGLLARFPEIPDVWTRLGTHALATVPLLAAGAVVGAMSFTFTAPRVFDADDRAFFLALGRQAAQAVERARLFDAERAAAAEAEAARVRLAFLANASAALGASLDVEATLGRAARLAVPALADFAVVDVVAPDGGMRRLAVAHRDPALEPLLAGTARHDARGPDGRHPLYAALDAGTSRLVEAVDDAWMRAAARGPAHLADMRALGPRSLLLVPLRVGDRVFGLLTLGASTSGRRFGPADLALAEEFAHRAAGAADNARLYAEAETARGTAEAERARATDANQAKSQFLANMSHELRTPLNAIGGYVQLLELELHGPVTDDQRTALARVQKAQHRLLALINDVLNFAKLESGRVEYDVAAVDVCAVVADVAPLVEPQAAARGLGLDLRLPGAPCLVWADREKLGQVLLNLLSNAIKFTEARHPTTGVPGRVTVHLTERAGRVDTVFLRVSDTGRGITRDKQDAIFEPFVQVRTGYAGATEGTGLGLAISRDLARGMGGDLRVRSVEGEGSTFTVTLRRVTAADGTLVNRRTDAERRDEDERRRGEDRRLETAGASRRPSQ